MALREFKDYPDTSMPINLNNLNYNFKEILNMIYPVGITVNFYHNEDMSNWLGFAWERTAIGKTLVGIDTNDSDFNEIGKIGGEKSHVLTINEMPIHAHNTLMAVMNDIDSNYGLANSGNYIDRVVSRANEEGNTLYGQQNIKNSGGNQSHNNLQPYQIVAYWKRVA